MCPEALKRFVFCLKTWDLCGTVDNSEMSVLPSLLLAVARKFHDSQPPSIFSSCGFSLMAEILCLQPSQRPTLPSNRGSMSALRKDAAGITRRRCLFFASPHFLTQRPVVVCRKSELSKLNGGEAGFAFLVIFGHFSYHRAGNHTRPMVKVQGRSSTLDCNLQILFLTLLMI